MNYTPSTSTQIFQVNGLSGYPIVDNYQDQSFVFGRENGKRSLGKMQKRNKSKFSRAKPVMMAHAEGKEMEEQDQG